MDTGDSTRIQGTVLGYTGQYKDTVDSNGIQGAELGYMGQN
jgi:hypothetical protein